MIRLLAFVFIVNVWALCNPSDPSCQDYQGLNGVSDAKRNAWKTQKTVYCDSTIEPIQHCKDLTPCSPKYLDCTKGPNRCVCEIVNPVADATSTDLKSVLDRISTISSLSTFSFVMRDPHFLDFVSLLNKAGPMTLFVPTNEAFQNAGVDTSNYQQMKEILKYHLIPNDALLTPSLFAVQVVTNEQGSTITVSKEHNGWMVDNAKVVLPDVRVRNGVIWLIDRVLTPKGVQSQGFVVSRPDQEFSRTSRVLRGTQVDVQGFNRPQQQNFQQLIGEEQQFPQSQQQDVTRSFIQGQGHNFIQGQGNFQGQEVVTEPQGFVGYPSGADQSSLGPAKSIAERVRGNPMLTTFAFLLNDPRYSDVVQLLSGASPVTVFIPTNEGFSKSGIDTKNVALVRDVLKHHIVPGLAINSADFVPFQKIFTAEGDKLKITQVNSVWMIDDAKIMVPDVQAKNGVIFLIDRVLVPPTKKTQLQNLRTSYGSQVSSHDQNTLQSQDYGGFEGQNEISSPSWNQGSFQPASRGFQGPPVSQSETQGQWHGAGLYCVAQTDLYYCNDKTECVLQESCNLGCVHANPGFPDYCFASDSKSVSKGLPNSPNFQLPNVNQPSYQPSQQEALYAGRWN